MMDRDTAEASIRKRNEMPVMGTDLKITGFGMDINGNSVIKLKQRYPGGNERGFSIQTNQNLPMIHSRGRFGRPSGKEMIMMSQEIANYIRNYGTSRQKRMLDGQTNLDVGIRRTLRSQRDPFSLRRMDRLYNRRLS